MKNLLNDKILEEGLLKSCLLFKKNGIIDKRESLFNKYVLALILSGKAKTITEIERYFSETRKDVSVTIDKINSAINELKKNDLIVIKDEVLTVPQQVVIEAQNESDLVSGSMTKLVDDIYEKIKKAYKKNISNELQVKENIKQCFDYYYEVMGLSFFDIDNRKEITEIPKLEELAGQQLLKAEREELRNHIIYAIGEIVDNPTEEQERVLEFIARVHLSAQILNIDPVLNSFKATIIRDKVFFLDTDVVLYAITENASHSKQYKMMIDLLINCGCKLYLPDEIVQEVYNHAEAATKNYEYNVANMKIDDPTVANCFKNIFVEDYYYTLKNPRTNKTLWSDYIGNYFNKKYGIEMTRSVIKDKLGTKIIYGELPKANIDDAEKEKLQTIALDETMKTEKAIFRDDLKNERIAKTDTLLYLTVRSLNNDVHESNSSNSAGTFLSKKFYFLTTSSRILWCANQMGIGVKVLCKPSALIAFLAEVGIVRSNEIKIIHLFDNPFLIHIANKVWPEVKKIVDFGVSVRGKNIVSMRYELEDVINQSLTMDDPEEARKYAIETSDSRGYPKESSEEIESLKKLIQDLKNSIDSQDLIIQNQAQAISDLNEKLESADRQRRKEKYFERVKQTKRNNHKKKRR